MEYSILKEINSPEDVKKLNISQTDTLCAEIRDKIIDTVSKNGGHLASSLGCVELTIALHRAFSSPEDAIIFDVGHQSYAHKLITGRFSMFDTIRKENGLSGFMRPDESEHDPFITGHSSNSISAAFGIAEAKRSKGEKGTAIAVIGDGAMTGGMAYEALNNAGSRRTNFIVILNDNKMSISSNVGSMSRSFTKMRNKPKYHRFKLLFGRFLLKIPKCGKWLYNAFSSLKDAIKDFVYGKNIFESMGFNYLGPVDGHNVAAMESLFKIAKQHNSPCLIHVITKKGKGYIHAEENPDAYHGVSPFDIEKGSCPKNVKTFSDIAGDTLCELAKTNSSIRAVTAAMADGTGLTEFAEQHSDKFYDAGIAEQHALTFTSALAKEGLKAFFVVYSSFLQRAYDQIIHDAAIGKFPLKLLVDRAGIVGEDGETHQGLFDVPFLSNIPNINIYSPSTYSELAFRIRETAENDEISAIRYPRGCESSALDVDFTKEFSIVSGKGETAIVTYGRLFSEACALKEESSDIDIVKLNKIYPLSDELINELKKYKKICFFEEGIRSGSVSEHIASKLLETGYGGKVTINAVDNVFVSSASVSSSLNKHLLDKNAMKNAISQ